MWKNKVVLATLMLAIAPASFVQKAKAEDPVGVTATEIRVGATFPFSGPASALGSVGKALIGYVQFINDKGGVNGRKIKLIALDDAYSPSKSVEQTRKLVESEEVAFLFSPLGTASISANVKYANSKKVPHLFVVSGANKFTNQAEYPYTTTGLPSYDTEGRVYAKYITEKMPGSRVAILYQNDDLGKDFVGAFRSYMKDDFGKLVVAKSYEAADPTVDSQVVSLKSSGAEAFFIAGSPKFTAQALRRSREIGWKPLTVIVNSTTSVAGTLAAAGLDNAKGVVSSTFLKDPMDPAWEHDPKVKGYRALLAKYVPGSDVAETLYTAGIVQGEILEKILQQCGDDLTRENIMKQALNLRSFSPSMALPGSTINTGVNNNQAWTSLQLESFDGKSWVPFGKLVSAAD
ncbi:ABC transporter substrate-binding protein [Bradyrhizobium sp. BR 1432]|uniref:ABC transporter substrate-binding protein n=1 Tax=Bradyrhizobium sp. BR 1432 TaxID=3447966 RepID=UPI003EE6B47C